MWLKWRRVLPSSQRALSGNCRVAAVPARLGASVERDPEMADLPEVPGHRKLLRSRELPFAEEITVPRIRFDSRKAADF